MQLLLNRNVSNLYLFFLNRNGLSHDFLNSLRNILRLNDLLIVIYFHPFNRNQDDSFLVIDIGPHIRMISDSALALLLLLESLDVLVQIG